MLIWLFYVILQALQFKYSSDIVQQL